MCSSTSGCHCIVLWWSSQSEYYGVHVNMLCSVVPFPPEKTIEGSKMKKRNDGGRVMEFFFYKNNPREKWCKQAKFYRHLGSLLNQPKPRAHFIYTRVKLSEFT